MTAAFTNFACRSGGSDLSAGTLDGSATEVSTTPLVTYTSANWVQSTRVFTTQGGTNPVSDGVQAGMFVSVYNDGASAPTGFVCRVTAVQNAINGTITGSATNSFGSAPSDGTGNRTMVVGGAWKGPNAASAFPWNQSIGNCQNAAGDPVRINLKNDQTYSITSGITTNAAGNTPRWVEGYTTTYGDGGLFVLDGGTSGSSFTLLTITAASSASTVKNGKIQNNGNSGSTTLVSIAGNFVEFVGVVVNSCRGNGVAVTGFLLMTECEVYGCNQSNTANAGGVQTSGTTRLTRCVVHDNTGSNSLGVRASGGSIFVQDSIFDSNGLSGLLSTTGGVVVGSDFYNNGGSGIDCSSSVGFHVESCNFLKNTSWGIAGTAWSGHAYNNGFGSGTQVNGSGTIQSTHVVETGSVTYATNQTPWMDPDNGDFRIVLPPAKGAGRGSFTETAVSYTGTVGYPDIGAAQHLETGNGRIILPPSQFRWR